MSRIFISYSRKDLAVAEKIILALAKDDLEPWVDWESIPKGEEFWREIQQGIEEAEIFLFLVSPDSAQSEWCKREIDHAVKNGKRILPIGIRDSDPNIIHPEISKRNWIFCRAGQDDFNQAIEEIRKTIHTDYEWLKHHTELQVKALEWKQHQDHSRLLRGKELREAEGQFLSFGKEKIYEPQPTSLQYELIKASRAFEMMQRRRFLLAGINILILLSLLGAFGLYQFVNATDNREVANVQILMRRSQELGSSALEVLNSRPDLALLLSIEAFRQADTFDSRASLANSMTKTQCVARYFFLNDIPVTDVIITAADGHLVAGNQLGNIYIWDLERHTVVELQSTSRAPQIDVNYDGAYLAIGHSDNGIVTILDARTQRQIGEIKTDFDLIHDLKFAHQSNMLAIAGEPPVIELWDVDRLSKISTLIKTKDERFYINLVENVAFNFDDSRVAGSGSYGMDGAIIIWDLTSNEHDAVYITPPDDVFHPIAFDTFNLDFSYGNKNHIYLLGEYYSSQITRIDTPSDVRSLLFRPSGSYLISGHEDGKIRWWNLSTPNKDQNATLADEYVGHGQSAILSLDILEDSSLMASGDNSGLVALWSPHECRPEYNFDPMDTSESDLGLPPDADSFAINRNIGRIAIVEAGSNEIRLRDLINNSQTETIQSSAERIGPMALSNSGLLLAAAELGSGQWLYGDAIRIWDLDSTSKPSEVVDISQLPGITALAFDSSESILALGSFDGRVFFYDLANGRFFSEPLSLSSEIAFMSYSPDGRLLAAADRAGKIMLWDISATKLLVEKRYSFSVNPFSSMQFSRDSSSLSVSRVDIGGSDVISGTEWELKWMTSPDIWMEILCGRVGRNFTISEWERYFPNEPYRTTCPQYPAGQ